jgi:hypothetical protein
MLNNGEGETIITYILHRGILNDQNQTKGITTVKDLINGEFHWDQDDGIIIKLKHGEFRGIIIADISPEYDVSDATYDHKKFNRWIQRMIRKDRLPVGVYPVLVNC